MVHRSKRSMSPFKANEMQKTTLEFQSAVRGWAGEIPIGSTVYVALQALNDSVDLMLRQLNVAVDEGKRDPNGCGRAGLHDFD
jgi:hypothetical protein